MKIIELVQQFEYYVLFPSYTVEVKVTHIKTSSLT